MESKELKNTYSLGIDIGSTTVKVAVLSPEHDLLFADYRRHFADIQGTLADLVEEAEEKLHDLDVSAVITGSGGLTLAGNMDIPFIQEVVAVSSSLKAYAPQTDVAIELGGEDAKIIYFDASGIDQRMNGTCAGGTGSFIDQMASLLQTDVSGLNEYAKSYKSLYTIAARCGVFAKSDIQPLINEGATKEDLAASIFQAVVNQTISGLACGRPIRGHVAFLGGPLHFLSELRYAFIRTLNLDDEHAIIPDNSHLFAAIGSAMNASGTGLRKLSQIAGTLRDGVQIRFEVPRMEPLFSDDEEYRSFTSRQERYNVKTADLETYSGNCYLGIDAGSTTTKAALVSENGELLYSFYSNNNGSPLKTAIGAVREIYDLMPEDAHIAYSCSTGYGEALIKAALMLDEGEVETIAHYYAASFFDPEVDCILDIGGQDMKCIKIKDNAVDSVQLNEACSSGCGSFIETFAKSLNYSIKDFAKAALFAKNPFDLGTRCTVFMNSKVKQAQKEGALVEDISAGLSYSVIKNALYKVIKVSDAKELGKHIVVQGGTFYNDGVLRAFEKIAQCEAIRPDIAGIMGAFGAGLIARERFHEDRDGEKTTTMLPIEQIEALKFTTHNAKCQGCTNHCRLTINRFSGGRQFISGNRCERGLGRKKNKDNLPNLYDFKEKLLFHRQSLPLDEAERGEIGIPRVLNMYELYPFWHTFFTKLKYRVVLSPPGSYRIYELGIESIPSESECYPAKIAHGHVEWLIAQGLKKIFYPCIPYERKEFKDAGNHFDCPIVTSYPMNIKNNVENLRDLDVEFLCPFIAFTNKDTVSRQLVDVFKDNSGNEIMEAVSAGWDELERCRQAVYDEGEKVIRYLEETGRHGIVLAGRPYHIDPEINHGIPELINSFGMAVLTEDSVSNLAPIERPLTVLDQWMYHSRLYAAAEFVKTRDDLDMIQFNSFGCGVDAVTTDQVQDILSGSGKIYTCLKIDEVNNLGAARIRIRSLIAAIRIKSAHPEMREMHSAAIDPVVFTKEMRKNYTILCPQMSPIHFNMLEAGLQASGYNLVCVDPPEKYAVDLGLKYVNNDACYPSIIVVGQMMAELTSGKYDLNKTAIIMSQTGGGCRASNYVGFFRRALKKAGLDKIPVISASVQGLESNPGFKANLSMAKRCLFAVEFGDLFMKCLYHVRPYEVEKGSADRLHDALEEECRAFLLSGSTSMNRFRALCRKIVSSFDTLPIRDEKKPRVGIVGEILVKYLPAANNHLVELLEKEGAEAVQPEMIDFFLYSFYNANFRAQNHYASKWTARVCNWVITYLEYVRRAGNEALAASARFEPPRRIQELGDMAEGVVSLGNQTGEGWFLTAEMLELIEDGTPNIVCIQPFGCLPNHVVGKGVVKEVRRRHPEANIAAIDFDPGASEVNQLNRIKLMLSTANKNL
ncbi:MAG: 2-hydroxyacyl-CoA dehydratase [Lachnospiraceae bacterium]|nr:2-hydroxyacyl-CoA dehydratase [Lachnospiraceae bacterium]